MNYYIVCPAGVETGGPELAHQMCHRLNEIGCQAKMYYIESFHIEPRDVEASPKYVKYATEHATTLLEVQSETSVVLFSEANTGLIPLIKGCRKALWWMSVDNYLVNTGGSDLDAVRRDVELHLVQSKYAYDYVKNTVGADESRILYVSDYIGEIYMTELPEIGRQNIALYNPKKGLDRLLPLIEKTTWLKWVPLFKLTESDMVAYMHISKIYVDFGDHPGKDRIPREAAMCGCCVITNRRGSAAYYEDVRIPDKYKFEDESELDRIEEMLHHICENYSDAAKDFDAYRDAIKGEKEAFYEEVRQFSNFFEIGG